LVQLNILSSVAKVDSHLRANAAEEESTAIQFDSWRTVLSSHDQEPCPAVRTLTSASYQEMFVSQQPSVPSAIDVVGFLLLRQAWSEDRY